MTCIYLEEEKRQKVHDVFLGEIAIVLTLVTYARGLVEICTTIDPIAGLMLLRQHALD